MIIIFFFTCFVLSCLPHLLHSAMPTCPESFSCQSYSPFKYPFYNSNNTECGLIEVNCTPNGGKIQLGGQSHTILYKFDSNFSFLIYNRTFENLVKEGNCKALTDNFTSPSPLLFSFSISPFITIFKCPKNLSDVQQTTDAYFDKSNFSNHSQCKDHNYFYYKHYNNNNSGVPSNLPDTCQVIQLPLKQSWRFGPDENTDKAEIFQLLPSSFSIAFPLSATCEKCLKNGSHCLNSNEQIQCFDVKKEIPSRGHTVILAMGVGVVALIVVAATISIVKILQGKIGCRYIKTKYNVNAELFLQNHEFLAPKRYSYSQVKKMTSCFKFKLGQGGFGSVYKGALNNGNLVAVKVLSELKGNGEDFINEVASVGRTSHVNIVTLVGFCLEGNRRALIYEFMPNGSLEKFIYGQVSPSNTQLGWEKLHQIAIGIARGLEYLHRGCNTRILHFDIKPHNILLDQEFCPKIADFGLAKLFPEKRSMISVTDMRGTPGYIAPELFSRSFGVVSHKSDVYSYGMMILEMVGGRKNIEVKVDHTSEIYFPHWIYKKIELHEDHLGLQKIVSDEEKVIAKKMIIVGLWCIQTNPSNRPTITKALEMLEGDLELLQVPPKPYISSPTRHVDSPSTCPLHSCYSSTDTL
uniref:rust resistance kinase Lr10-like n=1 Tax=Erigeron canadensis TaxID=72917 RepID=UPI001CB8FA72|nr:rust resistance kinase Lr10-like [Erigeron canadensis]